MRIALTLGLCLFTLAAVAAPRAKPVTKTEPVKTQTQRQTMRPRVNQNLITIMAGSPTGTGVSIANDIAAVLNDKDSLRILPIAGKGPEQNLKDVLTLPGVDLAITHANLLRYFARTGELGDDFKDQVAYVAKLFNEEIHIVARADIADLAALNGEPVNLGEEGSGTDLTGQQILQTFGVTVTETHLDDLDAIAKLKSGEIAAAIIVGGKPVPALAALAASSNLKLLPIPYRTELENDYYPAQLSHDDYPGLIASGDAVDSVAVCAVLISYNWAKGSDRYQKLAPFVNAFFGKFDQFLVAPRHPKWREVNFAATLEGWNRSPLAQDWIDRAKETASSTSQKNFEAFLAHGRTQGSAISDAERAELFRAFVEWSKKQPQMP